MENCVEEEDDDFLNYKNHSINIEKQWKFKDDIRTIDFVLVWEKLSSVNSKEKCNDKVHERFIEKRNVYEKNLIDEGLEIEYDTSDDGVLNFIKLHAPLEVLRRYSEILKLRMPMKEELYTSNKQNKMNPIIQATHFITQKIPVLDRKSSFMESACNFWSNFFKHNVYVDQRLFPNQKHRFTAVYSRDKEYLFDLESPEFFTPAIKSRIVQFILDRTSFSISSLQNEELTSHSVKENDFFNFGIERLLAAGVYSAAYPLHDGDLRTPGSMRYLLHKEWASVNKWYCYQPVDHIRGYFGVKIGLYFAWLGFYTHMLFPAAVVGVACFVCSWFTLKYYKPSEDICSNESNIKMCPLCDVFCDFWDLQETCFHSKVAFLFDNNTTVFFAVFMSFWATMFLEMWKRYSAEITHRWDLTGFDAQEESPRPQYLARLALLDKANLAQYKLNVITNSIEPRVPFWRIRFPATIFSFSIVLLLVALALAAVLGVVLYRMSVLAALSVYGDSVITSYAILFTTATAATINLICIFIFNWIYAWLSEYLTELEMNRTQSEFDDSLTLKMYLLQFVNYYASIFYIAFCKGKLVGFPAKYNRLFGFRQEECGPGGCLMELCIQLAIIMVGKQAFNTCLEMVFPLLTKWWKTRGRKKHSKRGKREQWEKDYKLVEWGAQALFPEYLEMVLQYGFVTIFVAAFPLAPLFALINNVLEMRLDAKKLLTFHRRPVSQRVKDIGVWFRILDSISKLAVITNVKIQCLVIFNTFFSRLFFVNY
uniref:Anoctamin n=2 Tax=Clastoptera arizonana TaxID=38151 RepID=A0A1B6D2F2_9HEMI